MTGHWERLDVGHLGPQCQTRLEGTFPGQCPRRAAAAEPAGLASPGAAGRAAGGCPEHPGRTRSRQEVGSAGGLGTEGPTMGLGVLSVGGGWLGTGCGRPAVPSQGGNVPLLASDCWFPPAAGTVPEAGDSGGGTAPTGPLRALASLRLWNAASPIPPPVAVGAAPQGGGCCTPGRLLEHPTMADCTVHP